jgi:hypothetical protein
MKVIKIIPVLMFLFLNSCSSVMVNSDYDNNVDFSRYKTFGFQKKSPNRQIADVLKPPPFSAVLR